MLNDKHAKRRSWLITGAWFGTIVLLGVLKRAMDKQQHS